MSKNDKIPCIENVMKTSTGLKRTMTTKAAIMTGVGSTIGTGLFLSSGDVIGTAGPGGALVAYLIGGIIVFLMTSCLGELSSAMPVAGSLQAYSSEFIHSFDPSSGTIFLNQTLRDVPFLCCFLYCNIFHALPPNYNAHLCSFFRTLIIDVFTFSFNRKTKAGDFPSPAL